MFEVSTINDQKYESSNELGESNMKCRYQKRIIESKSERNSKDESSISSASTITTTQPLRRRLLTMRDGNS